MCWENWVSTWKRIPIPHHTEKFNPKWISDLHVGPDTLKCLEEHIGKKTVDIDLGTDFLYVTPKAKIHKWYYIQFRSFYTEKEIISKS